MEESEKRMRSRYAKLILAVALIGIGHLSPATVMAEAAAPDMQAKFNRKYQQYLGPDSQMLLPFPLLEASEWKRILESKPLVKVYSEPGKYYNSKVYTFTVYRTNDSGEYYLNAKGGFWGMDELSYGPLTDKDFD